MLCFALVSITLSGCSILKKTEEEAPVAQQAGNFSPETTAVASGGLMQVIDEQNAAATPQPTYKIIDEAFAMDIPEDAPVDDAAVESTPEDAPAEQQSQGNQVYATPSPQPNASVGSYAEISGTGLGFKFSYPANWNNIPGRSTVCYVQPMEDGTVYPARVAVSMKKVAHKCDAEDLQEEMILFFETIQTQYDSSTFEVDKNIDDSTRFMGNNAYSTTYLAYDDDQEIEGYVIMTAFEKYVFCFHFQCAYTDYNAFAPTMKLMRDSVKLLQDELE